MNPLWAKGNDGAAPVPAAVMAFLAGDDVVLDRSLFPFDLRASAAHARGLARVGVIAGDDAARIDAELAELGARFADGRFVLDDRFEDGHSAIEAFLTERLGDLGKRIHTGRSRNDQVQVALRLHMKDALARLEARCVAIARAALAVARENTNLPMPGHTHLQRAVPSSVGFWMASFVEAFTDDALFARATAALVDSCPLGTAAGFGVNLALDRAGVAADLGFARTQENGMYVQGSRGKFERAVLAASGQALLDARRLAWDLSLFATAEFGFVRVADAFTTGSSLMPNKRNPDVVELLRAAASVTLGAEAEIAHVLSFPSGYQRDLQLTKGPYLRGVAHADRALALVPELLTTLAFDADRMRAAIDDGMYATDRATELALAGLPFRDAYRRVGAAGGTDARSPEASLAARVSPGSHADLGLDRLEARLDALENA